VYVYRHDNIDQTQRSLAFVVKYKPPHKPTLLYLHTSLREMDIQQEVVNRSTMPTDKDELFSYQANRVIAAALSQTYYYITTGGLTYSYITTGEAIIFLKVDGEALKNLLFHLQSHERRC
ncbi:hypothetical protein Micbo1qcDRAFT_129052, partial [Microdochium bolleyi]